MNNKHELRTEEFPVQVERLKNTPEERIKELIQQNHELRLRADRAYRKVNAQRNEIKRLNRAMIERNYRINKWSAEIATARDAINQFLA